MSDIITRIMSKMGAKIIIEVSPSTFVFYKGERMLAFETCIYLKDRDGSYVIAAVGNAPDKAGIRIDLFGPEPLPIQTIQREWVLESFMRHALSLLFSKSKLSVRPRVYFRNAESLSHLLIGYQFALLRRATESAGALSVDFIGCGQSKTV